MATSLLAERRELSLQTGSRPAPPTDEWNVADWPIIGAGAGCNTFLADLGIEDGLIAFTPTAEEPRSLFVVGLRQLRHHGGQLRQVVRVADRVWAQSQERALRFVDLPAGFEADAGEHANLESGHLVGLWSSPLDDFGQAVVAQRITSSGRLELFLLRHRGKGRLKDGATELLKAALPLFLDAVLAFCITRRQEQRAALLRVMFDHMTLPTLLVDERARPLVINHAAAELLHRRVFILQGADGLIAARVPRENRALRAAVQRVATAGCDDHENDMVAIRLTDRDAQWQLAVVVPARSCTDAGVTLAAMIVIHEPATGGVPPCILSALGLLPSEQRFLDQFLRSSTLTEAAERSSLSHETARTYLKRVRSKLGAHRQMDLARLIYGLIPPVGNASAPQISRN